MCVHLLMNNATQSHPGQRRLCHWVNIQIKFLVVLITDFHYIRLIVDRSGVDAFPDPCLEY